MDLRLAQAMLTRKSGTMFFNGTTLFLDVSMLDVVLCFVKIPTVLVFTDVRTMFDTARVASTLANWRSVFNGAWFVPLVVTLIAWTEVSVIPTSTGLVPMVFTDVWTMFDTARVASPAANWGSVFNGARNVTSLIAWTVFETVSVISTSTGLTDVWTMFDTTRPNTLANWGSVFNGARNMTSLIAWTVSVITASTVLVFTDVWTMFDAARVATTLANWGSVFNGARHVPSVTLFAWTEFDTVSIIATSTGLAPTVSTHVWTMFDTTRVTSALASRGGVFGAVLLPSVFTLTPVWSISLVFIYFLTIHAFTYQ
jgi:hypothetical protein